MSEIRITSHLLARLLSQMTRDDQYAVPACSQGQPHCATAKPLRLSWHDVLATIPAVVQHHDCKVTLIIGQQQGA